MDSGRFDALTRGAARATSRRAALAGVLAAVAGLGARGAAAQVDAERCLGRGDDCSRRGNCCRGLRCRRGECEFKNNHGREGDWCERNRDCDRGLACNTRRNRCEAACLNPGERCRRDTDCCGQALCADRNNRCCFVRGATCRASSDCCTGLTSSNGICRN